MIASYDIDGVLAKKPPESDKPWRFMTGAERKARQEFLLNWYATAPRLYEPTEDFFFAVSARKATEDVARITMRWLNQHFPDRVLGVRLLNKSRTVENAAQFKADVIIAENVTVHYEDNKKVLRKMAEILPSDVDLYFWEEGMDEPVYFSDEGK